MKSAEEIMDVLEAYDLTGSYRDAAELAGLPALAAGGQDAAREPAARRRSVGRAELVPVLVPGHSG
jgi:hypothetical protein